MYGNAGADGTPNPFSTNASPPNSVDSRDPDPFSTSSYLGGPNHPTFYRDETDSDMADPNYDRRERETVESELNLVDGSRASRYTNQGAYDSYNGAYRWLPFNPERMANFRRPPSPSPYSPNAPRHRCRVGQRLLCPAAYTVHGLPPGHPSPPRL